MNPFATTSPTTATPAALPAAFTPEPGLPWLRTDPAMQCPEAFQGMSILTLRPEPYAPMARHFPATAVLALVRVTRAEDLTEGVYLVNGGPQPNRFGRFAGLSPTSNERARARRLQQGFAHFELSTDVAVAAPRQDYLLREDGTFTCYVNFNDPSHKLWRVTHYVSLAADELATLADATPGTTAAQQRWLAEEKLVCQGKGEEYRLHVLGSLPDENLRAVVSGEQVKIMNYLFEHAKPLPYSQAKRRKGSVAVTTRVGYTGRLRTLTDYYRREDVAVLLDWFASLARAQRAEDAARLVAERNKAAWQQQLAQLQQRASTALAAQQEEPALAEESELALAA